MHTFVLYTNFPVYMHCLLHKNCSVHVFTNQFVCTHSLLLYPNCLLYNLSHYAVHIHSFYPPQTIQCIQVHCHDAMYINDAVITHSLLCTVRSLYCTQISPEVPQSSIIDCTWRISAQCAHLIELCVCIRILLYLSVCLSL